MKESEIFGNNEEYPEHYEVLSGLSLLLSRSGKNRKTEGLQGKKVKKMTSCNTDLCVTQGRLILVFSWVLSGYQFLPFWKKLRMRGFTLKYVNYSHSIVAGGLEVISYTMRFTPLTSFTMRREAVSSTSYGIRAQSAVIKSLVVTARSATV